MGYINVENNLKSKPIPDNPLRLPAVVTGSIPTRQHKIPKMQLPYVKFSFIP